MEGDDGSHRDRAGHRAPPLGRWSAHPGERGNWRLAWLVSLRKRPSRFSLTRHSAFPDACVHEFAKQSGPVRGMNPIGGILPVLASLKGLSAASKFNRPLQIDLSPRSSDTEHHDFSSCRVQIPSPLSGQPAAATEQRCHARPRPKRTRRCRRTDARKTNRGRVAGRHHSIGEPLLCANAIAVSMDVRRGDQLGGAITPPNGCGGRIWTAQSACPQRPAEGGARVQAADDHHTRPGSHCHQMKIPRGEWLDQRWRPGTGPLGREGFCVRTDP